MPQISKEALIEQIKDGIIVFARHFSRTALSKREELSPLLVKAAEQGGVVGIRANSVRDIKEIKGGYETTDYRDYKRDYPPQEPFITATMREVDELAELILRSLLWIVPTERYDGLEIQDFIRQVKENIRINS